MTAWLIRLAREVYSRPIPCTQPQEHQACPCGRPVERHCGLCAACCAALGGTEVQS